MKNIGFFSLASLAYFAWFYGFVGLRSEHFTLYLIVIVSLFVHPNTRKFIYAFGVFIVYWILYDSMRVVPNYTINPIHIQEPYLIEKTWFGFINTEGVVQTWNEYFKLNPSPILDLITGLAYLNWVPIPLSFAFYLFLKHKRLSPISLAFASITPTLPHRLGTSSNTVFKSFTAHLAMPLDY
jgi:inositol phosphorylceramide synthase catalytic subunit